MFRFFSNWLGFTAQPIPAPISQEASDILRRCDHVCREVFIERTLISHIRDGNFIKVENFLNKQGISCLSANDDIACSNWSNIIRSLPSIVNKTEGVRIFKLLLERGADVRLKMSRGDNLLIAVIETNFFENAYKTELVKSILDHDASLINELDSTGKTPLFLAIQRTNLSVFNVLVEYNAMISEPDLAMSSTQLLWGLLNFMDKKYPANYVILETLQQDEISIQLFEYLIDRGADVNSTNIQGETVSDIASRNNREDIVALLQNPPTLHSS